MKAKSYIFIILAGMFWGTSGLFVAFLKGFGFDSFQMTSFRALFSLIFLSIFFFIKEKEIFKIKLKQLPLLIGSGVSMYLCAACYYIAMQRTSVPTAVVLMYTSPVFVMMFSAMFLGEKLTPVKLISLAGVFFGCGLVAGIIGGMKYDLVGLLIGLASGITFCAYNVIVKIEMRKGYNPSTVTIYCYIVMTILAFIVAPPTKSIPIINDNSWWLLAAFAVFGVCTSGLPYFLYTLSLKNLPAGTASCLGVVEPLAATLYSVLFLGEKLGLVHIIGMILIIGSVVLLSRTEE